MMDSVADIKADEDIDPVWADPHPIPSDRRDLHPSVVGDVSTLSYRDRGRACG